MKLNEITYHGTIAPVLKKLHAIDKGMGFINPRKTSEIFWMMIWMNTFLQQELMSWTNYVGPRIPKNPTLTNLITRTLISGLLMVTLVFFKNQLSPMGFWIVAFPTSLLGLYWSFKLVQSVLLKMKKAKAITEFVVITGIIPMIKQSRHSFCSSHIAIVLLIERLMRVSRKAISDPSDSFKKEDERRLYDRVMKLEVFGNVHDLYAAVYSMIIEEERGLPVGSEKPEDDEEQGLTEADVIEMGRKFFDRLHIQTQPPATTV